MSLYLDSLRMAVRSMLNAAAVCARVFRVFPLLRRA